MGEAVLVAPGPPKKTMPYVIAYLDLLGTTTKINSEHNLFYLNCLYHIYDMADKMPEKSVASRYGEIKIKIFSDNIVVAIPLRSAPDEKAEDVSCLLSFVSYLQCNSVINYRWLIRGGITIGDLFLDDLMIWGKGLIRAYMLENEIAFYPRIVIDPTVASTIENDEQNYISEDQDGWYYLNFLNYTQKVNYNYNICDRIQSSYTRMCQELKEKDGKYPDKPLQKVQWHRSYVNRWYHECYNTKNDLLTIPLLDSDQIS